MSLGPGDQVDHDLFFSKAFSQDQVAEGAFLGHAVVVGDFSFPVKFLGIGPDCFEVFRGNAAACGVDDFVHMEAAVEA